MSTKQAFKTYSRGQRIQDTNVTFASGMNFTNAPLEEGFSKLLVNYDFGEDGNTLRPRKGIQTTEEGLFKYVDTPEGYGLEYLNGMTIVAGNILRKGSRTFYQVIVGKIDIETFDTHTETFKGDAWVLTCERQQTTSGAFSIIHYVQLNDTSDAATPQKCLFKRPLGNASIHDVSLKTSEYIKTHIGTFAFNGEYYYFTVDGSGEERASQLHHTFFDENLEYFDIATVTAFEPYQSETQNSLYNMLLAEPYSFANESGSSVFRLTGFMPCDNNGLTVINPQSGINYNYKLFYAYPEVEDNPERYVFHIEYNTGVNDVWYPITRDETAQYPLEEEDPLGKDPFIFEDIKVDSEFAQFRIYAVPSSIASFNDSKQLDTVSLAKAIVLVASFNYIGVNKADSVTNLGLKRYDLAYTTGMIYWKNRIWLYGAKDRDTGKKDNTILFASEPNRPDWFPYTAGADIFDEEIIYLQPMLEDLLVFTSRNLYSITLSDDGLNWTRKHLQSNLNISYWDLNLIRIVKNMVFFKSGNYYYMVVPKLTAASGAGLAIAPISKNIKNFLDNFQDNVERVVDDLYNYSCTTQFGDKSRITYTLDLIHYYNYLDYEDVHNCYIFNCNKYDKKEQKTQSVYLNFELLYNTVSRTWRIYIQESQELRQPLFMNATGKGRYAESVIYKKDNKTLFGLQFLEYSNTDAVDYYIKQNQETSTPAVIFNNWQYLDTGNLAQVSEFKKRFREYQFKINNSESKYLEFYSGFMLDKSTRTYEILYTSEVVQDEDGTATIIVDAQPLNNLQGAPQIRNKSVVPLEQQYQYTKLGSWKLGTSMFPITKSWKIRIPTSGKGYLPRLIFISYNNADYELLSCATVYRQLNSR